MVNSHTIDSTFAALAHPVRRRILELLARGEATVTALAEPFRLSLPAISKHLRVLERAGLVLRTRMGRVHRMRADPSRLAEAREWITQYAAAWEERFKILDQLLEDTPDKEPPK